MKNPQPPPSPADITPKQTGPGPVQSLSSSRKLSVATAAAAATAVIGLWIWFNPPPRTELTTLCLHLNQSVTNAHCTVALAPDAFPVANVIDVGINPDPRKPLPVTLRDLLRSCWIEKQTRDAISRDVIAQPKQMDLPKFTADIDRAAGLSSNFDLTEGIPAKFKAGTKFSSIKSISVELHKPSIQSLDQGVLERHLADSRSRENCLDAVLKPESRLIVSVIMAEGLDYKIVTKDGATLTLDAAAKGDIVKLETSPDPLKSNDSATTLLKFSDTRVVAALFADKPMLDALRAVGARLRGSVVKPIDRGEQSLLRYKIKTPTAPIEGVIRTNSDLARLSEVFGRGFTESVLQAHRVNTASVRTDAQVLNMKPATISGSFENKRVNLPTAPTATSQVALEADFNVAPAMTDLNIIHRQKTLFGETAARTEFKSISSPVETELLLRGEFGVYKRRDPAETVTVTLRNKGTGPTATVLARLVDEAGSTNGQPEPRALKVGESHTFKRELKDLGVYRVIVEARIDQAVTGPERKLREAIDVTVEIK